MGRLMILAGAVLAALGFLVLLLETTRLPLGRLPGDIVFRSRGGTFYFPVVTCILLSLIASLVLWLLNRR